MQSVHTGKSFTIMFMHDGNDNTQALVINNKPYVVAFAEVTRHVNDQPNRRLAEKFVLTKALAASSLNKAERTEIWDMYFANFMQ